MKSVGVILLAFGGADSLDAVEPFMTNLMGGRKPSQKLVERTIARYKLIGGGSPLPKITFEQAQEVEKLLNNQGSFRVLPGMRYWHPFISEAINKLHNEGIKDIVAVSLSPHFSSVTTGAYLKEIERVVAELGNAITVRFAEGWYEHPLFIEGLIQRTNEALSQIPKEHNKDVIIIFSAHSLPLSHIAGGDSYMEQMEKTVHAMQKGLVGYQTKLAFQSKGGGQGEWLGPEVEQVMDELGSGATVVVVPIGFACDHIETLYDIDIAQKNHAKKLGINFYRALALNTSPLFMQCLADVIRKTIQK